MTRWLPFEGHLLCPTDRPAQPASPQTPPESPIDAPRFGHLAEIPRETWANRSRAKTASIFRFSRQPIQWLSSDTTNHWIISSDYPVIIQWLSSDYHSWSSDTTQLWSTGRPPKKNRPFFHGVFVAKVIPAGKHRRSTVAQTARYWVPWKPSLGRWKTWCVIQRSYTVGPSYKLVYKPQ